MNLKSKAITEIRSTILTLSAHPHNEPHTECTDRIEGLQVLLGELEQPEWVSVTERLPNIGDRVLVSDYDGHIEICNYVVSHFSKRYNGEPVFMNEQDEQPDYVLATHWTYLPQPPTK